MKFVVYHSDTYYPGIEEFDDYVEAMKDFSKLKESRINKVDNKSNLYFDKDYLCIVISEIDAKELAALKKIKIVNGESNEI
jgi:hypothetical protein